MRQSRKTTWHSLPLQRRAQPGFSLLEVLVAILVLAIGLLGLAAMQAQGLKSNQSALSTVRATILANDILDRMRANRTAAMNGDYDRAFGASAPTGSTVAIDDLGAWLAFLAQLPAGDGSIDCTTTANRCTVAVRWDDSRAGNDPTNAASSTRTLSFTSQI